MENTLDYVLLVIWFLVTFIYLCTWLIGNRIKEKSSINYGEKGRNCIRIAMFLLIFYTIWIIYKFLTLLNMDFLRSSNMDDLIISSGFALVALFVSIGTFYLSKENVSKLN